MKSFLIHLLKVRKGKKLMKDAGRNKKQLKDLLATIKNNEACKSKPNFLSLGMCEQLKKT